MHSERCIVMVFWGLAAASNYTKSTDDCDVTLTLPRLITTITLPPATWMQRERGYSSSYQSPRHHPSDRRAKYHHLTKQYYMTYIFRILDGEL
ncbi:hypothetical protein B0I35DRAFT_108642 [Stachybotrys elegans]|uniref:Secreted protein n=1 Tax=Stachybotrys elegans TaxID=80388 RepID=A0A8K0SGJ9_9HYPO|nr:hypothetical protein B0I35DRAFT_108642 [Stachybotrys elegans]